MIEGLLRIPLRRFEDERGWFAEIRRETLLPKPTRQTNLSFSRKGVLRGLHYQEPHPQGKLVRCVVGSIWDVAVDIRRGSPTFGRSTAVILSAENKRHFWIPEGFAHGFVTLTDDAAVTYQVSAYYSPQSEGGARFDDPAFGIEWPVPVLEAGELLYADR
mgnify:CR=1 FL=1